MQDQAAGDQHGVRDGGAAAGAHIDIGGAALSVQFSHAAHGIGVEDFRKRLLAQIANVLAIEGIALAAGEHAPIVFHVHSSAP
jgi:hypothetical protein